MRRPECAFSNFAALDIRVAVVVAAEPFEAARVPAMLLHLDCGQEVGVLKTSAQITQRYTPGALLGKRVLAVVNLPKKQIGPILSECLILGAVDPAEGVTLLCTDHDCAPGAQIA